MKPEPLIRVVKAPHDWICDECGAVIKREEECVKMGKRKMCAKHVKGKEASK